MEDTIVVINSNSEEDETKICERHFRHAKLISKRLWDKASAIVFHHLSSANNLAFPYDKFKNFYVELKKTLSEVTLESTKSFIWHNLIQWLIAMKLSYSHRGMLELNNDEKFNFILIDFMAEYINYKCKLNLKINNDYEIHKQINEILGTLGTMFNGNSSYIVMTLVKIDVYKEYTNTLKPIFNKILSDKHAHNSEKFITYLELILCFKQYQKLARSEEEIEAINKIAVGKNYSEKCTNIQDGILPRTVPSIDTNCSFMTISDLIGHVIKKRNSDTRILLTNESLDLDEAIENYFIQYERKINGFDPSTLCSSTKLMPVIDNVHNSNKIDNMHKTTEFDKNKFSSQHKQQQMFNRQPSLLDKQQHLSNVCDINTKLSNINNNNNRLLDNKLISNKRNISNSSIVSRKNNQKCDPNIVEDIIEIHSTDSSSEENDDNIKNIKKSVPYKNSQQFKSKKIYRNNIATGNLIINKNNNNNNSSNKIETISLLYSSDEDDNKIECTTREKSLNTNNANNINRCSNKNNSIPSESDTSISESLTDNINLRKSPQLNEKHNLISPLPSISPMPSLQQQRIINNTNNNFSNLNSSTSGGNNATINIKKLDKQRCTAGEVSSTTLLDFTTSDQNDIANPSTSSAVEVHSASANYETIQNIREVGNITKVNSPNSSRFGVGNNSIVSNKSINYSDISSDDEDDAHEFSIARNLYSRIPKKFIREIEKAISSTSEINNLKGNNSRNNIANVTIESSQNLNSENSFFINQSNIIPKQNTQAEKIQFSFTNNTKKNKEPVSKAYDHNTVTDKLNTNSVSCLAVIPYSPITSSNFNKLNQTFGNLVDVATKQNLNENANIVMNISRKEITNNNLNNKSDNNGIVLTENTDISKESTICQQNLEVSPDKIQNSNEINQKAQKLTSIRQTGLNILDKNNKTFVDIGKNSNILKENKKLSCEFGLHNSEKFEVNLENNSADELQEDPNSRILSINEINVDELLPSLITPLVVPTSYPTCESNDSSVKKIETSLQQLPILESKNLHSKSTSLELTNSKSVISNENLHKSPTIDIPLNTNSKKLIQKLKTQSSLVVNNVKENWSTDCEPKYTTVMKENNYVLHECDSITTAVIKEKNNVVPEGGLKTTTKIEDSSSTKITDTPNKQANEQIHDTAKTKESKEKFGPSKESLSEKFVPLIKTPITLTNEVTNDIKENPLKTYSKKSTFIRKIHKVFDDKTFVKKYSKHSTTIKIVKQERKNSQNIKDQDKKKPLRTYTKAKPNNIIKKSEDQTVKTQTEIKPLLQPVNIDLRTENLSETSVDKINCELNFNIKHLSGIINSPQNYENEKDSEFDCTIGDIDTFGNKLESQTKLLGVTKNKEKNNIKRDNLQKILEDKKGIMLKSIANHQKSSETLSQNLSLPCAELIKIDKISNKNVEITPNEKASENNVNLSQNLSLLVTEILDIEKSSKNIDITSTEKASESNKNSAENLSENLSLPDIKKLSGNNEITLTDKENEYHQKSIARLLNLSVPHTELNEIQNIVNSNIEITQIDKESEDNEISSETFAELIVTENTANENVETPITGKTMEKYENSVVNLAENLSSPITESIGIENTYKKNMDILIIVKEKENLSLPLTEGNEIENKFDKNIENSSEIPIEKSSEIVTPDLSLHFTELIEIEKTPHKNIDIPVTDIKMQNDKDLIATLSKDLSLSHTKLIEIEKISNKNIEIPVKEKEMDNELFATLSQDLSLSHTELIAVEKTLNKNIVIPATEKEMQNDKDVIATLSKDLSLSHTKLIEIDKISNKNIEIPVKEKEMDNELFATLSQDLSLSHTELINIEKTPNKNIEIPVKEKEMQNDKDLIATLSKDLSLSHTKLIEIEKISNKNIEIPVKEKEMDNKLFATRSQDLSLSHTELIDIEKTPNKNIVIPATEKEMQNDKDLIATLSKDLSLSHTQLIEIEKISNKNIEIPVKEKEMDNELFATLSQDLSLSHTELINIEKTPNKNIVIPATGKEMQNDKDLIATLSKDLSLSHTKLIEIEKTCNKNIEIPVKEKEMDNELFATWSQDLSLSHTELINIEKTPNKNIVIPATGKEMQNDKDLIATLSKDLSLSHTKLIEIEKTCNKNIEIPVKEKEMDNELFATWSQDLSLSHTELIDIEKTPNKNIVIPATEKEMQNDKDLIATLSKDLSLSHTKLIEIEKISNKNIEIPVKEMDNELFATLSEDLSLSHTKLIQIEKISNKNIEIPVKEKEMQNDKDLIATLSKDLSLSHTKLIEIEKISNKNIEIPVKEKEMDNKLFATRSQDLSLSHTELINIEKTPNKNIVIPATEKEMQNDKDVIATLSKDLSLSHTKLIEIEKTCNKNIEIPVKEKEMDNELFATWSQDLSLSHTELIDLEKTPNKNIVIPATEKEMQNDKDVIATLSKDLSLSHTKLIEIDKISNKNIEIPVKEKEMDNELFATLSQDLSLSHTELIEIEKTSNKNIEITFNEKENESHEILSYNLSLPLTELNEIEKIPHKKIEIAVNELDSVNYQKSFECLSPDLSISLTELIKAEKSGNKNMEIEKKNYLNKTVNTNLEKNPESECENSVSNFTDAEDKNISNGNIRVSKIDNVLEGSTADKQMLANINNKIKDVNTSEKPSLNCKQNCLKEIEENEIMATTENMTETLIYLNEKKLETKPNNDKEQQPNKNEVTGEDETKSSVDKPFSEKNNIENEPLIVNSTENINCIKKSERIPCITDHTLKPKKDQYNNSVLLSNHNSKHLDLKVSDESEVIVSASNKIIFKREDKAIGNINIVQNAQEKLVTYKILESKKSDIKIPENMNENKDLTEYQMENINENIEVISNDIISIENNISFEKIPLIDNDKAIYKATCSSFEKMNQIEVESSAAGKKIMEGIKTDEKIPEKIEHQNITESCSTAERDVESPEVLDNQVISTKNQIISDTKEQIRSIDKIAELELSNKSISVEKEEIATEVMNDLYNTNSVLESKDFSVTKNQIISNETAVTLESSNKSYLIEIPKIPTKVVDELEKTLKLSTSISETIIKTFETNLQFDKEIIVDNSNSTESDDIVSSEVECQDLVDNKTKKSIENPDTEIEINLENISKKSSTKEELLDNIIITQQEILNYQNTPIKLRLKRRLSQCANNETFESTFLQLDLIGTKTASAEISNEINKSTNDNEMTTSLLYKKNEIDRGDEKKEEYEMKTKKEIISKIESVETPIKQNSNHKSISKNKYLKGRNSEIFLTEDILSRNIIETTENNTIEKKELWLKTFGLGKASSTIFTDMKYKVPLDIVVPLDTDMHYKVPLDIVEKNICGRRKKSSCVKRLSSLDEIENNSLNVETLSKENSQKENIESDPFKGVVIPMENFCIENDNEKSARNNLEILALVCDEVQNKKPQKSIIRNPKSKQPKKFVSFCTPNSDEILLPEKSSELIDSVDYTEIFNAVNRSKKRRKKFTEKNLHIDSIKLNKSHSMEEKISVVKDDNGLSNLETLNTRSISPASNSTDSDDFEKLVIDIPEKIALKTPPSSIKTKNKKHLPNKFLNRKETKQTKKQKTIKQEKVVLPQPINNYNDGVLIGEKKMEITNKKQLFNENLVTTNISSNSNILKSPSQKYRKTKTLVSSDIIHLTPEVDIISLYGSNLSAHSEKDGKSSTKMSGIANNPSKIDNIYSDPPDECQIMYPIVELCEIDDVLNIGDLKYPTKSVNNSKKSKRIRNQLLQKDNNIIDKNNRRQSGNGLEICITASPRNVKPNESNIDSTFMINNLLKIEQKANEINILRDSCDSNQKLLVPNKTPINNLASPNKNVFTRKISLRAGKRNPKKLSTDSEKSIKEEELEKEINFNKTEAQDVSHNIAPKKKVLQYPQFIENFNFPNHKPQQASLNVISPIAEKLLVKEAIKSKVHLENIKEICMESSEIEHKLKCFTSLNENIKCIKDNKTTIQVTALEQKSVEKNISHNNAKPINKSKISTNNELECKLLIKKSKLNPTLSKLKSSNRSEEKLPNKNEEIIRKKSSNSEIIDIKQLKYDQNIVPVQILRSQKQETNIQKDLSVKEDKFIWNNDTEVINLNGGLNNKIAPDVQKSIKEQVDVQKPILEENLTVGNSITKPQVKPISKLIQKSQLKSGKDIKSISNKLLEIASHEKVNLKSNLDEIFTPEVKTNNVKRENERTVSINEPKLEKNKKNTFIEKLLAIQEETKKQNNSNEKTFPMNREVVIIKQVIKPIQHNLQVQPIALLKVQNILEDNLKENLESESILGQIENIISYSSANEANLKLNTVKKQNKKRESNQNSELKSIEKVTKSAAIIEKFSKLDQDVKIVDNTKRNTEQSRNDLIPIAQLNSFPNKAGVITSKEKQYRDMPKKPDRKIEIIETSPSMQIICGTEKDSIYQTEVTKDLISNNKDNTKLSLAIKNKAPITLKQFKTKQDKPLSVEKNLITKANIRKSKELACSDKKKILLVQDLNDKKNNNQLTKKSIKLKSCFVDLSPFLHNPVIKNKMELNKNNQTIIHKLKQEVSPDLIAIKKLTIKNFNQESDNSKPSDKKFHTNNSTHISSEVIALTDPISHEQSVTNNLNVSSSEITEETIKAVDQTINPNEENFEKCRMTEFVNPTIVSKNQNEELENEKPNLNILSGDIIESIKDENATQISDNSDQFIQMNNTESACQSEVHSISETLENKLPTEIINLNQCDKFKINLEIGKNSLDCNLPLQIETGKELQKLSSMISKIKEITDLDDTLNTEDLSDEKTVNTETTSTIEEYSSKSKNQEKDTNKCENRIEVITPTENEKKSTETESVISKAENNLNIQNPIKSIESSVIREPTVTTSSNLNVKITNYISSFPFCNMPENIFDGSSDNSNSSEYNKITLKIPPMDQIIDPLSYQLNTSLNDENCLENQLNSRRNIKRKRKSRRSLSNKKSCLQNITTEELRTSAETKKCFIKLTRYETVEELREQIKQNQVESDIENESSIKKHYNSSSASINLSPTKLYESDSDTSSVISNTEDIQSTILNVKMQLDNLKDLQFSTNDNVTDNSLTSISPNNDVVNTSFKNSVEDISFGSSFDFSTPDWCSDTILDSITKDLTVHHDYSTNNKGDFMISGKLPENSLSLRDIIYPLIDTDITSFESDEPLENDEIDINNINKTASSLNKAVNMNVILDQSVILSKQQQQRQLSENNLKNSNELINYTGTVSNINPDDFLNYCISTDVGFDCPTHNNIDNTLYDFNLLIENNNKVLSIDPKNSMVNKNKTLIFKNDLISNNNIVHSTPKKKIELQNTTINITSNVSADNKNDTTKKFVKEFFIPEKDLAEASSSNSNSDSFIAKDIENKSMEDKKLPNNKSINEIKSNIDEIESKILHSDIDQLKADRKLNSTNKSIPNKFKYQHLINKVTNNQKTPEKNQITKTSKSKLISYPTPSWKGKNMKEDTQQSTSGNVQNSLVNRSSLTTVTTSTVSATTSLSNITTPSNSILADSVTMSTMSAAEVKTIHKTIEQNSNIAPNCTKVNVMTISPSPIPVIASSIVTTPTKSTPFHIPVLESNEKKKKPIINSPNVAVIPRNFPQFNAGTTISTLTNVKPEVVIDFIPVLKKDLQSTCTNNLKRSGSEINSSDIPVKRKVLDNQESSSVTDVFDKLKNEPPINNVQLKLDQCKNDKNMMPVRSSVAKSTINRTSNSIPIQNIATKTVTNNTYKNTINNFTSSPISKTPINSPLEKSPKISPLPGKQSKHEIDKTKYINNTGFNKYSYRNPNFTPSPTNRSTENSPRISTIEHQKHDKQSTILNNKNSTNSIKNSITQQHFTPSPTTSIKTTTENSPKNQTNKIISSTTQKPTTNFTATNNQQQKKPILSTIDEINAKIKNIGVPKTYRDHKQLRELVKLKELEEENLKQKAELDAKRIARKQTQQRFENNHKINQEQYKQYSHSYNTKTNSSTKTKSSTKPVYVSNKYLGKYIFNEHNKNSELNKIQQPLTVPQNWDYTNLSNNELLEFLRNQKK